MAQEAWRLLTVGIFKSNGSFILLNLFRETRNNRRPGTTISRYRARRQNPPEAYFSFTAINGTSVILVRQGPRSAAHMHILFKYKPRVCPCCLRMILLNGETYEINRYAGFSNDIQIHSTFTILEVCSKFGIRHLGDFQLHSKDPPIAKYHKSK